MLKQFAGQLRRARRGDAAPSGRVGATGTVGTGGAVGADARGAALRRPRDAPGAPAHCRAAELNGLALALGRRSDWLRGLFARRRHERRGRSAWTRSRPAAASLHDAGYIAEPTLAAALLLMLDLGRPLLLEGDAGVGKTEVAKALAAVRGARLIRLQCYEGLDAHAAMYEWNYQRQLLAIKLLEHDDRAVGREGAGHLLGALPAQAPAARGDQLRERRRCC